MQNIQDPVKTVNEGWETPLLGICVGLTTSEDIQAQPDQNTSDSLTDINSATGCTQINHLYEHQERVYALILPPAPQGNYRVIALGPTPTPTPRTGTILIHSRPQESCTRGPTERPGDWA